MNEVLVEVNNQVLAKILMPSNFPPNLTFYTSDSDFVQVATWNYNKGKHLKAHAHKLYARESNRTNEVIYIKSGSIRAYFYDETDKVINTYTLNEGTIIIIFAGGHAYDILDDNTQVLEVKNGPYPGIDADKKSIES